MGLAQFLLKTDSVHMYTSVMSLSDKRGNGWDWTNRQAAAAKPVLRKQQSHCVPSEGRA